MRKYIRNTYPLLFICLVILSCTKQTAPETEEISQEAKSDDEIRFTQEQMEFAGIETGKAEVRSLATTISCNGIISTPPKDKFSVYSPIQGFVQRLNLVNGQYVKRGTLLTRIKHQDLIRMQQSYFESKRKLTFLENELQRQKDLVSENATAQREVDAIQLQYDIEQTRMEGFKAELQLVGLSVDKLDEKNIRDHIEIYAPSSGYITRINVNPGKYTHTEDLLFEIIDTRNNHIELNIYQQDILKVKAGQSVSFSLPGNNAKYHGKIKLVSKSLDPVDNAFLAHVEVEKDRDKLTPGAFIQASIFLSEEEVLSLPKSAIIRKEDASFIFIRTRNGFKKKAVDTGMENDIYVEILDDEIRDKELAVKGVYYILGSEIMEE